MNYFRARHLASVLTVRCWDKNQSRPTGWTGCQLMRWIQTLYLVSLNGMLHKSTENERKKKKKSKLEILE